MTKQSKDKLKIALPSNLKATNHNALEKPAAPQKKKAEPMRAVTIRINAEMYNMFKIACAIENNSVSSTVAKMMQEKLDAMNDERLNMS